MAAQWPLKLEAPSRARPKVEHDGPVLRCTERAESRARHAVDAASTQVYKQTIEDAICELHDKVRANQIQIIDGTYSTRALRLLLSK